MENHSEVCLENAGGIWGLLGGGDGCSSADIHVTHPGEEMEENGNEVSGGYLVLESVYLLIQQRWNQDLVVVQRQVRRTTVSMAWNLSSSAAPIRQLPSVQRVFCLTYLKSQALPPQPPPLPFFSLIIFLLQRCLRGSGRGNGEAHWGN